MTAFLGDGEVVFFFERETLAIVFFGSVLMTGLIALAAMAALAAVLVDLFVVVGFFSMVVWEALCRGVTFFFVLIDFRGRPGRLGFFAMGLLVFMETLGLGGRTFDLVLVVEVDLVERAVLLARVKTLV